MLPMAVLKVNLNVTKVTDAVKVCSTNKKSCAVKAKELCLIIHKNSAPQAIQSCLDKGEATCSGTFRICKTEAENSGDEYKVTLSVSPNLVPDPSRLIEFRQNTNYLAHDTIDFKLEDGLLSTVNAKAEDRTPKILENLAQTAINAFKFYISGGLSPTARSARRAGSVDCNNQKEIMDSIIGNHTFSIPLSAALSGEKLEVDNSQIQNCGINYKAFVTLNASHIGNHLKKAVIKDNAVSGVFVSIPQPYQITAQFIIADSIRAKVQTSMKLPDDGPIFQIPFDRAYFAFVDHKLILDHGMLISLSLERPSAAEGLGGTLLNISSSLAALPGEAIAEIIKVKYDGPTQDATQASALVDAQTKLIESQQKLEEARKKLEENKEQNK